MSGPAADARALGRTDGWYAAERYSIHLHGILDRLATTCMVKSDDGFTWRNGGKPKALPRPRRHDGRYQLHVDEPDRTGGYGRRTRVFAGPDCPKSDG